MPNAFVLMTALPPTTGHLDLIKFARSLDVREVVVVLSTQPDEPMVTERIDALYTTGLSRVRVHSINRTIEQNPDAPGFWEMWRDLMKTAGMTSNDVVVASEPYGQKVADLFGAKFMPYDVGREMNKTKATDIRLNLPRGFGNLMPSFQPYLRKTITLFGAESVGKTTMSRQLASFLDAKWVLEYARPYLETVSSEITIAKMEDIWQGQDALQRMALAADGPHPFIVQDTDLYSTVGYWEMWSEQTVPDMLRRHASLGRSDLYIILAQDEVPFEADPLRYGGDKRESTDQYWIDLCEREGLNYVVVDGSFPERHAKCIELAYQTFYTDEVKKLITYEREHN